jgi:carbamoyltransferase
MYILGVQCISNDSSAALIKDGKVLFAIEEERLSGVKHTTEFPLQAVRSCLSFAGITIDDVDVVCLSHDVAKHIKMKLINHWLSYFPRANERMVGEFDTVKRLLNLEQEVREKLQFKGKIFFCRHHLAHMASAYYLSTFKESALFSIDGVGDIESSMIGYATGNTIKIFEDSSVNWPHSIGSLYTSITHYLGFLPHCDEGKVMGLASYGNPKKYKKLFEKIVTLKPHGKFEINLDYFNYPFIRRSHVSQKFIDAFGPVRVSKSEITQNHMDIAAGLQYITEETMLHVAKYLRKKTGSKNLSLAGGVALNCVANGRVLKEAGFKNIFIQPAAGDAGIAIGSALFYYYQHKPKAKRFTMDHAYLGNEYSDAEIEKALTKNKLKFEKLAKHDTYEKASCIIAGGGILGWFNGRMEFGPRALGNRSIITAPFPAEMKDILNSRVKHRESFRPFAPIVRLQDCGEYFDHTHESPFMLLTYNVKKDKQTVVPAITHVDGTARVQTITKQQNEDIYNLISTFKKQTGVGVILNTSFNIMGQPIIYHPDQAIECFRTTGIDCLIFNGAYIVEKNNQKEWKKKS